MLSLPINKATIIAIVLLTTIGMSVGVMASNGYGPFALIRQSLLLMLIQGNNPCLLRLF